MKLIDLYYRYDAIINNACKTVVYMLGQLWKLMMCENQYHRQARDWLYETTARQRRVATNSISHLSICVDSRSNKTSYNT